MSTGIMSRGIGKRLIDMRRNVGKSQGEIAEYLNLSQSAYGKIELGERGLSSEYCIMLADLYGVTCDYILRGIGAYSMDAQRPKHLSGKSEFSPLKFSLDI